MSNRFLLSNEEDEFLHPLILGYCDFCSLMQLVNPVTYTELKAKYNWIRYSEPEGHLDQVAQSITELPNLNSNSILCGISGHETSLITRMQALGFKQSWQLNLNDDLHINDDCASVESIQYHLTVDSSKKILKKRGLTNVIIARNILEHAHHPLAFMEALKNLGQPGGYIVIEVPDNTRIFEMAEYSILWEEHTLYFTPYSFLKFLQMAHLDVQCFKIYPYFLENVMVAIVRIPETNECIRTFLDSEKEQEEEVNRGLHYSTNFDKRCSWYHDVLSKYHQKGPIVLFGASHLACHFINLFKLKDLISFVMDDHPKKISMRMPGSRLPILPSQRLEEKGKLCLLSLSQESEYKVMLEKKYFTEKGGKFASIFSNSKIALSLPT